MSGYTPRKESDLNAGCLFGFGGAVAIVGCLLWIRFTTGWLPGIPLVLWGLALFAFAAKKKRDAAAPSWRPPAAGPPPGFFLRLALVELSAAGVSLLIYLRTGRAWFLTVPLAAFLYFSAVLVGISALVTAIQTSSFFGRFRRKPPPRPVYVDPAPVPFVIQVTAKMKLTSFMIGGILFRGRLPKQGDRFVIKRTGKTGTVEIVTTGIETAKAASGNRVVVLGDAQALQDSVTFTTRDIQPHDVQIGDMLIGV
jgi:hypothetical protein